MIPLNLSLLFHFIGIGMIFTTIIGGWILDNKYRKASDWKTKLIILQVLRPIGLLSPISVVLMLFTGVSNMHLTGLGVFTASWLTLKLVFFTLTVISGLLFGIRGSRRTRLVAQLARGEVQADGPGSLKSLDRQQRLFFLVQSLLILIILSLSLFRPQA